MPWENSSDNACSHVRADLVTRDIDMPLSGSSRSSSSHLEFEFWGKKTFTISIDLTKSMLHVSAREIASSNSSWEDSQV